ncbi:MAG: class B sortase [Amphibacillus sp.]|nr:class B sortase [Amphibacillus sp.]
MSEIKKVPLLFFMLIGVIGILYSSISIYETINQYQVSAHKYQEIEQIYYEYGEGRGGYQELLSINPDFIGWLEINNTRVSYPVVKTQDNDFYLSHNFYNEVDPAGAIFIDYRNNLNELDKNIILYGHNMKDGSMFGLLKEYLDQDFLAEYNVITFDSLDTTYIWEVFSVYETEEVAWMETTFTDLREYEIFLDKIINRSIVNREITVDSEDNILTLATCTVSDEKRFVIHAKLIKKETL